VKGPSPGRAAREPDHAGQVPRERVVVLGAGIAGLATARELRRRGCDVVVIEKAAEVGGLARTFEQDGFRFDLGGHRFHSNNPSVVRWLQELLRSDLLTVPRFSRIHLEGQFVDYPIRFPGALSIFPPLKAARMVGSYLLAKVTEAGRRNVSFEDWVVKRYGRSLYAVFFKPYTEKVWGIPCSELSEQWASQRIGIPSLWRAVHHSLLPPKEALATAVSEFYYPRRGFGMICNRLHAELLAAGGRVSTRTVLVRCTPGHHGFKVTVSGPDGALETIEADRVVSTIPLSLLLASIPEELGSREILSRFQLEYRDVICLFLALKRKQVSRDSWTYFPSKKLVFGRTHEPRNWSSEMVPNANVTSLAVEIFSSRGEAVWQLPDGAILELVAEQMSRIGWIARSDIFKWWVLRVPFAYPVYRVGYEDKLRQVKEYLGRWPHLHLVGRTGSFKYMNSDGVIEDVFRFLAELPAAGAPALSVDRLLVEEGRWL
jgi:protoporphyrinogen oxidase